jgi:thiamine kinase-like enzyme
MLPLEIERLALCRVPGSGSVDIRRLRGGLMNDTYRVRRDAQTFALRVASRHEHEFGLDRAFEARVLAVAAAQDLAPAIIYSDPQGGILLSRWAAGHRWNSDALRRPANVARIALLLQRIHALPLPSPARIMSPKSWVDYYSAAGRGTAAAPYTAALRDSAVTRLAALAALPGTGPVLCHSDLHTLNLIDDGRTLKLLDWEYAHASDPFWDLAGWSANNDLNADLTESLLANYSGRCPTPDERSRLATLTWLYDYVCLLWSERYLESARQPGAAPDGVAARAARLAARLSGK